MKKVVHKTEAIKGQFDPFLVAKTEIVLTSVSLQKISPTDRIVLRLEVAWDKPLQWDMGELDIMIREGSPNGPVVYTTTEACFYFAHTKLEHTIRSRSGQQIYYLTVSSAEARARIVGPYSLEGIVYDK